MTRQESIGFRVVEAVAEAEGVASSDIEFILDDYVDTDALEMLSRGDKGEWKLSFEVPGHTVTVDSDRTVTVDG